MSPEILAVIILAFIFCLFCLLVWFWIYIHDNRKPAKLNRFSENPILSPDPTHWWESEAVFNPGVVVHDGLVHLFYRAMGHDGISRIGYAKSSDGISFERYTEPVFDNGPGFKVNKTTESSYQPLSYNTDTYASGGGWAGVEDPRAVIIDDEMYMSFSLFEGWQSIRLAITALQLNDLNTREWKWKPHIAISPKNETNKNWVLFPEKINGKFAILHALTPSILVEYVDSLDELQEKPIQSNNKRGGRAGHWDAFVRGAAAPPIKTEYGWLLFYHGMDPAHPAIGYKVGAMLLDLKDPSVVLHRSNEPILVPEEWYENDWKPGVVYASGAVVLGDDIIVYYGGGDKYIAAAKINLRQFIRKLMTHRQTTLVSVSK